MLLKILYKLKMLLFIFCFSYIIFLQIQNFFLMGKLFEDVYIALKKSDKFKNAFLDLNSTAIFGTIAEKAQE